MAILAECDICAAQHRVKDALSGRSICCKECGVSISVPVDQWISTETFFERDGRLYRHASDSTGCGWTWIVTGLTAALVATALGTAAWMISFLWRTASAV